MRSVTCCGWEEGALVDGGLESWSMTRKWAMWRLPLEQVQRCPEHHGQLVGIEGTVWFGPKGDPTVLGGPWHQCNVGPSTAQPPDPEDSLPGPSQGRAPHPTVLCLPAHPPSRLVSLPGCPRATEPLRSCETGRQAGGGRRPSRECPWLNVNLT